MQHRKKEVKPVETTEEPFLLRVVVENFAIRQRFLKLPNINLNLHGQILDGRKISLHQPHRNIRLGQMLFHFTHCVFTKMKNAGRQHRIRLAFL